MRVESKLRIERIITKDGEILLEMEEGHRGGTYQKAQGSALIASKTAKKEL